MNLSTFTGNEKIMCSFLSMNNIIKMIVTCTLASQLFSIDEAFAVPPDPISPIPGTGFMYIGPNPAHAFDNAKRPSIGPASDDPILDVATPPAACKQNMEANFALLKKSATVILNPQDRPQMDDVRMQIVHFRDPKRAGNTNYAGKEISLDVGLCDKPEINQQGVIAHELGHMISIYRSKEAARIIADERQYPNITFSQNELTMEAYANQYGAQIMRGAGINCMPWLEIIDKECSLGSQYFCREADNWRGGLTY